MDERATVAKAVTAAAAAAAHASNGETLEELTSARDDLLALVETAKAELASCSASLEQSTLERDDLRARVEQAEVEKSTLEEQMASLRQRCVDIHPREKSGNLCSVVSLPYWYSSAIRGPIADFLPSHCCVYACSALGRGG